MNIKLYHRNVYWKSDFDKQSLELIKGNISFTNHIYSHLKEENSKKRYYTTYDNLCDIVEYCKGLKLLDFKPYEVEIDCRDTVSKCCIRLSYTDTQDISLVFRKNLLITYWINDKKDVHTTLDRAKYRKR